MGVLWPLLQHLARTVASSPRRGRISSLASYHNAVTRLEMLAVTL